jgi:SAM-dependent methyltransferase
VTEDTTYIFSQLSEQTEYERLQMQEATFDWVCQGRLASLGLGPGSVCLEAGVGAGSMLRWMAAQVGPQGKVVGVDLDDRFFRPSEGPSTELRKDDLRSTPLPDGSFDFVHARLLLLHLQPADRQLVLERFLRALRPGGWFVALDPAYRFTLKHPTNRAEELLLKLLASIARVAAPNADFTLGDRLPDLLEEGGFAGIEGYGVFPLLRDGGPSHTYLFNVIETFRKFLPPSDPPMTNAELDELAERLRTGELGFGWPMCIAWGQRPPG